MTYVISDDRKVRIIIIVAIFFTFFTAMDLYADEGKTQLELNQDVFDVEEEVAVSEMRTIDIAGNMFILKPVEIVKRSTEKILLMDKIIITHQEIEQDVASYRRKDGGPKVRLTF